MIKKILRISILATAICSIVLGLFSSENLILSAPAMPNSFTVPVRIDTFGEVWDGQLTYGLFQTNVSNGPVATYLIVMKSNGTLLYLRQSDDPPTYELAKNIAPGVIMFQGEPFLGGATTSPMLPTHFWNYVDNTTQDFPTVVGHHDIEYDPFNNTFLTLQNYVRTVGNYTLLFDKIVQLDANGSVLWSWDTYNYIPLQDGDPFQPTTIINGTTLLDFTHANALDWDYNDSIVYLNLRHTNTFYKINQTTGDLIWACGEHGNFTLLASNGTEVSSLWYHSHATERVSEDTFIMFDNDYANETNPNDCTSRISEVTINEKNMTARVSWTWAAPDEYWTPYWGKADRLPNGHRIGTFGTATHQFPQNQPWNGTDTGAVIVEVNETGNVVRTYTFPPGWGIYRTQEMIYPTPIPQPSQTPQPSSNQPTMPPPTDFSPSPTSDTSAMPTQSISPTSNSQSEQSPNPSTTSQLSPHSTPKSPNIGSEAEIDLTIIMIIITAFAAFVYFGRRKKHMTR